MNIKLQAMLNGVAAVRERYGDQAVDSILAKCDPAVRERCETGIAIEWHDVQDFCHFLEHAERELGQGGTHVSEMIGTAGAEKHTRSWFKRAAMFVASPEYVIRKVTGAWSRFNDQGTFDVIDVTDGQCSLRLTGIDVADPHFCATITGWARVMGRRVGWDDASVAHIACRGHSDADCLWQIRWTHRP